ncbi:hypothetical protein HDV05_001401 [Chytridiales sp. JEL 0842]|nr:hypothetical protein HDV05_001401 [Chytridiales sp. JEL 0842]
MESMKDFRPKTGALVSLVYATLNRPDLEREFRRCMPTDWAMKRLIINYTKNARNNATQGRKVAAKKRAKRARMDEEEGVEAARMEEDIEFSDDE